MSVDTKDSHRDGKRDTKWIIQDDLSLYHNNIFISQHLQGCTGRISVEGEDITRIRADIVEKKLELRRRLLKRANDTKAILDRHTKISIPRGLKDPERLVVHVEKLIYAKQQELNKLKYKKQNLQGKYEKASARMVPEPALMISQIDLKTHELKKLTQLTVVRRNEATFILHTFKSMFTILKKDSEFYKAVLCCLVDDKMEQVKIISVLEGLSGINKAKLDKMSELLEAMQPKLIAHTTKRDHHLQEFYEHVRKLSQRVREVQEVEKVAGDSSIEGSKSKHLRDACLLPEIEFLERTLMEIQNITVAPKNPDILSRLISHYNQFLHILKAACDLHLYKEKLIIFRKHSLVLLKMEKILENAERIEYLEKKRNLLFEMRKQLQHYQAVSIPTDNFSNLYFKVKLGLANVSNIVSEMLEPADQTNNDQSQAVEVGKSDANPISTTEHFTKEHPEHEDDSFLNSNVDKVNILMEQFTQVSNHSVLKTQFIQHMSFMTNAIKVTQNQSGHILASLTEEDVFNMQRRKN